VSSNPAIIGCAQYHNILTNNDMEGFASPQSNGARKSFKDPSSVSSSGIRSAYNIHCDGLDARHRSSICGSIIIIGSAGPRCARLYIRTTLRYRFFRRVVRT